MTEKTNVRKVPRRAKATAKKAPASTKAKTAPNKKGAARLSPFEFEQLYAGKSYTLSRILHQQSFYFRLTEQEQQRGVLEVFHEWLELIGSGRLGWWRRRDRQEFSRFDAQGHRRLQTYLERDLEDRRGVRVLNAPAKDGLDVLAHARQRGLELFLHPRGTPFYDDNASWLRMTTDPADVEADPSRWCEAFLRACDRIPVSSGTAGPVLMTGAMLKDAPGVDGQLREALMAHVYVDMEEDFERLLLEPTTARGVGWLTAIGIDAVAKLGGETELRRALGDGIEVHNRTNALVIQIGDAPRLGAQEDELLPVYRHVRKLLDPLVSPVTSRLSATRKSLMERLLR